MELKRTKNRIFGIVLALAVTLAFASVTVSADTFGTNGTPDTDGVIRDGNGNNDGVVDGSDDYIGRNGNDTASNDTGNGTVDRTDRVDGKESAGSDANVNGNGNVSTDDGGKVADGFDFTGLIVACVAAAAVVILAVVMSADRSGEARGRGRAS